MWLYIHLSMLGYEWYLYVTESGGIHESCHKCTKANDDWVSVAVWAGCVESASASISVNERGQNDGECPDERLWLYPCYVFCYVTWLCVMWLWQTYFFLCISIWDICLTLALFICLLTSRAHCKDVYQWNVTWINIVWNWTETLHHCFGTDIMEWECMIHSFNNWTSPNNNRSRRPSQHFDSLVA